MSSPNTSETASSARQKDNIRHFMAISASAIMEAGWPGQLHAGQRPLSEVIRFVNQRLAEGWRPKNQWEETRLFIRFPEDRKS